MRKGEFAEWVQNGRKKDYRIAYSHVKNGIKTLDIVGEVKLNIEIQNCRSLAKIEDLLEKGGACA